jgi:hypothetical protein
MPTDTTIIAALCAVISTLAGAIAYLYRDNLKRADERVARLEQREDEVLQAISGTMGQLASTISAIHESHKKLADYITELQMRSRIGT